MRTISLLCEMQQETLILHGMHAIKTLSQIQGVIKLAMSIKKEPSIILHILSSRAQLFKALLA